jgi:hypothetical protein
MGMTMTYYLNRQPVLDAPWGGGNGAVKALQHLPTSDNPDVILIMGLDDHEVAPIVTYMADNPQCRLILRVNDCDAHKGTFGVDDRWLTLSKIAHGTIFVSNWMWDHIRMRGWACQNNTVIYNGVDYDAFKPATNKTPCSKLRIASSHWSDNAMKGQDYYEWLDDFVGKHPDKFEYTFIGRTKAQFKNSRHVQPLFGRALGEELAKHDICVNASRWDPGPNSVTESIACGLPTLVHKDGGGGVEFAGSSTPHTFASFDELEEELMDWFDEGVAVMDEHMNPSEGLWCSRNWSHFADDVQAFCEK